MSHRPLTHIRFLIPALILCIGPLAPAIGQAYGVTYGAVTPKNKSEATVLALLDTAFNKRHYEEAFARYVGPYYRQHNPTVPDGKQAVIHMLREWLPKAPALHYDFKHVYSDSDRVIVHSHLTVATEGKGMAVVDIFRLEHGKVVERWDVVQAVPDKALNDNTMF